MKISERPFNKGDMVCYSSEWLDNLPPTKRLEASLRRGIVLSDHRRPGLKYVRVKWDDNRSLAGTSYSPTFIKKLF